MWLVRVCILLASTEVIWASDVSPKVAEFVSLVNGDYDNTEEVKNSSGQIAHFFVKFVPIYNPAFQPSTTWYDEYSMNGVLLLRTIGFITDGPGDMIYLSIVNYTDVSKLKAGQIDHLGLSKAKTLNLTEHNCTAVYKRLARGIYAGIWPACNHVINKHHPFYAETLDCHGLDFFTPPSVKNIYAQTLMSLRRTGKRYPMPGIPDSFDSICPRNN